jgi:hypothetical protein
MILVALHKSCAEVKCHHPYTVTADHREKDKNTVKNGQPTNKPNRA